MLGVLVRWQVLATCISIHVLVRTCSFSIYIYKALHTGSSLVPTDRATDLEPSPSLGICGFDPMPGPTRGLLGPPVVKALGVGGVSTLRGTCTHWRQPLLGWALFPSGSGNNRSSIQLAGLCAVYRQALAVACLYSLLWGGGGECHGSRKIHCPHWCSGSTL